MMSRRSRLCSIGAIIASAIAPTSLLGGPATAPESAPSTPAHPNIVYILCDDLGYGDVQSLNPLRGKIPTPHLDQLVAQGMTFTNAHAGASVCTPSRYGILTGRYSWRSRLQASIISVFDAPLIAADRLTVPGLLKQHGYHTAGTGKWHLGCDVPMKGNDVLLDRAILNGPVTRGFDEYRCVDFRNFPPYMYIENDRFVGTPVHNVTSRKNPPAITEDEYIDALPTTVDWAVKHIGQRAADRKTFFLFVAPTAPHTPLAVTKEYQGKSGLNRYADYVMELDAEIGRVLTTLDQNGLTDNTLVVFTSDNGCAPYINVKELEAMGHYASERSRGYKADLLDGGHRMPFIARWPGKVKPGSKCDQLVCLTDLLATCAEIVGAKLPDNAGEDSISILPLLLGQQQPTRSSAIHHSITGKFSLREGKWKLLLCPGSGGWSEPDDPQSAKLGLPAVQLYDMDADAAELKNLQADHPEVVARLTQLLLQQLAAGRSTPGAPQKNDVPVDVFKTKN